ncbi:hypothetical protein [Halomonas sp. TD01]|nr:hypothetical protein [Halomonas sp. TD01]CAH1044058.1 hypothetical protein HPTD01_2536 [Halomonas sp. TD01]
MSHDYLSLLSQTYRLLRSRWVDAVVRTGAYPLTRTALSEWYNE